jgi:hydrogenase expression/formation protein HypC
VPDARAGDYVLVHAGLAISVIDEAEARRVLAAVGDEPDEVP